MLLRGILVNKKSITSVSFLLNHAAKCNAFRPKKFAILDKPDKAFKKDVKNHLKDLKFQQKQIIKDNKDYAIKNYGNRPDFNPTNKYYLPTNKLDDLRNLDFKVKDLTRYLKNLL